MGKYRRVEFLPSLNPLSVTQAIQVMVLRKWFVPVNWGDDSCMHVLLRDGKGNRCEAVIQPYKIPVFDPILRVGLVYIISGFSVVEMNHIFPPSEIPFTVMFHDCTEVIVTTYHAFSNKIYHDTNFMWIKSVDYDLESARVDVFGAVVDYMELPEGDGESCRMLVLLEDLRENLIRVVLKYSYYVQFKSYADDMMKRNRAFFVILHLFRPVLWNGDVVLESCKFMSDLIIDQKHPEIVQYKLGLHHNLAMSRSSGVRVMSYSIDIANQELFGLDVRVLSLSELLTTGMTGTHWVIGRIQDVFMDSSWYTTKCYRCKTKVPDSYSKVFCDVCCCYIVPNARYRLHVCVVDGVDCAKFLMLDDTAYELIGRTAAEVITDILKVNGPRGDRSLDTFECTDIPFPNDIHMTIGDQCLFKVEIGADHTPHGSRTLYKVKSVKRCSNEMQLVLGVSSSVHGCEGSTSSRDGKIRDCGESSTSGSHSVRS